MSKKTLFWEMGQGEVRDSAETTVVSEIGRRKIRIQKRRIGKWKRNRFWGMQEGECEGMLKTLFWEMGQEEVRDSAETTVVSENGGRKIRNQKT